MCLCWPWCRDHTVVPERKLLVEGDFPRPVPSSPISPASLDFTLDRYAGYQIPPGLFSVSMAGQRKA